MNIGLIKEIKYKYPKTKLMGYFYNVESLIAEVCTGNNKYDGAQKHATQLEKDWIGNRKILDYTNQPVRGLSPIGTNIISTSVFVPRASGVYMATQIANIFGDSVRYSVYNSFGRGSSTEISCILLSSNTILPVREMFNAYGNEKFNIAIKVLPDCNNSIAMRYGISIASVGSPNGIKGDNRIQVIEYDDNMIYIDDASKYLSNEVINILTEGLSM